jgi:hypothetical protein
MEQYQRAPSGLPDSNAASRLLERSEIAAIHECACACMHSAQRSLTLMTTACVSLIVEATTPRPRPTLQG